MKYIYIISLFFTAISPDRLNAQLANKLEIIRIDSTTDHFVFKTKNETGGEVIVLIEKERVNDCRLFKKFIISDSIHQTSAIKSGSRKDLVGFSLSTIDGIKIRNAGELVKIIWGCNCFADD